MASLRGVRLAEAKMPSEIVIERELCGRMMPANRGPNPSSEAAGPGRRPCGRLLREAIVHHGVVAVAQAADRTQAFDADAAVHDDRIVDMNRDNDTQDHRIDVPWVVGRQLDRLEVSALKMRRG